jgi:anti-sigma B factor antagonist
MRDGQLNIEKIRLSDDLVTIRLSGPLTLANLFELQDAVRADPCSKTVVDLSQVPYIDSAGLGALLSFHASCKRTGRNYVLAALVPRVHTMFAASKVDKLVNIVPTVEEAEAFLAQ